MVQERIESLLSIKKGYLVIFFLIAIDLASKFIAEEQLNFGQAIPLIPILDLLLVFNSGIAFSILDFNNSFLSFGLSLIGLLIVAYLHSLYKNEESSINRFSLILIISGALGNIFDRLPDGVVTDFLFFHLGETPFFIFNFADAYITIGAVLFFLMEFKKFLQNRSG
jgi:signal peptidase II|tara:strand:- start:1419 stop:1919 length:501 start_codon:yes stop_codon:yes gene_type:complete